MPMTESQHASSLEVGARFRSWRLERVIGQGGMGTIFLARHELVGRAAAIKVLRAPPGARPDDAARARFQIETELYVALRHPNLPEFFDAEVLPDGTAVLVLEYLDGYDLANALARVRRLSVGDALFVTTEVLRALAVMHETSVHRDVKPSNIFLCRRPRLDSEGRLEKGRVRLLDFGIAKLKGRAGPTEEYRTVGTSSYMSPEQLVGSDVDGRSDQYSLGLVLYESIVGHPLFVPNPEETPPLQALLYQHVHVPAPDIRTEVADVPADVCELVARLLSKEPKARFPRTEDALDAARALRTTHRESAKLFREDVDDLVMGIEALREERWAGGARPVPNPMRTDQTGRTVVDTDEGSITTTRGTRRMKAPTVSSLPSEEPSTDAGTRVVERLREVLRAPRCFKKPALERLDSITRAKIATIELGDGETILGSGAEGVTHVVHGKGVEPRHAVFTVRRDRRVDVRLAEGVSSSQRALRVEGVFSPWGGQLFHGTRLALGYAELVLVDLATSNKPPMRRTNPARLTVRDPRGRHVSETVIATPLTLIGSSPACDLVVRANEVPDVVAAVWLRGDAAFEWVDIDASVLPHGDPIIRTAIVNGSTRIDLPGGFSAFLEDAFREGVAPSSPPPAPTPAPTTTIPIQSSAAFPAPSASPGPDRLIVCGKRSSGLRGVLRDSYPLPDVAVMGRSKTCDIVVDHELVSDKHVELTRSPGGFSVRDLGSANGTFVNRKRVKLGHLGPFDYLDIGGAVSFQLESSHLPRAVDITHERSVEGAVEGLLRRFKTKKTSGE